MDDQATDYVANLVRVFSDALVSHPEWSEISDVLVRSLDEEPATIVTDTRAVFPILPLVDSDPSIVSSICNHPTEALQALRLAVLTELETRVDPKIITYLQQNLDVSFHGWLGRNAVNPRSLTPKHHMKYVSVVGFVTHCGVARPMLLEGVQICEKTNEVTSTRIGSSVYNSDRLNPDLGILATKTPDGHARVLEKGLSRWAEQVTATLQECPEHTISGQIPRSIVLILRNDLGKALLVGWKIRAYGVFKITARKDGSVSSALHVTSYEVLGRNKENLTKHLTPTLIRLIRKIADHPFALPILASGIAPTIACRDIVKAAILMQMIGPVNHRLSQSTMKVRDRSHILLIGEPSTGKSVLLRYVKNVVDRAVSTTGRSCSAVGLTAAVVTDPISGERKLEAGAMVNADQSIICIDEFDKINPLDRGAIHEVMEQGTVSITKAGISVSLKAACTVLAACNPAYGHWDSKLGMDRQVCIESSLLSRFDLILIMHDPQDAAVDAEIAQKLIQKRNSGKVSVNKTKFETEQPAQVNNDILEVQNSLLDLLDQKDCMPQISEENMSLVLPYYKLYVESVTPDHIPLEEDARTLIVETYCSLRQYSKTHNTNQGAMLTTRALESMLRLASCHAKLKLRNAITIEDARVACSLLEFSLTGRTSNDAHTLLSGKEKQRPKRKLTIQNERSGKREDLHQDKENAYNGQSEIDVVQLIMDCINNQDAEIVDLGLLFDLSKKKFDSLEKNTFYACLNKLEEQNKIMLADDCVWIM